MPDRPLSPSTRSRAARGAWLLFALLAVDAALYWRYLRATWTPPPPRPFSKPVRWVPPETLLRLGWVREDKDSSFVRFEKKKAAGVVRVGCLGDSFTYGDEVDRFDDYPGILQRLFRERGYPHVEVINFGSSWYGFSQTLTLWNDVARDFDLDYVLLGPKTFFPERDTTFDHASPRAIHFLHARHVLEADGLRLVEPVGDTFARRAAGYRRFVPYWRYLRYDRRAPAFLACLAPGRALRNPFYYRLDIRSELSELYPRMLSRMAEGGAQVLLAHYEGWIADLGRGLGRENLGAARLEQLGRFPYRTPNGHNSPSGNRLLAEQYFALLTGRSRAVLPRIEMRPLEGPAERAASAPARTLEIFSRVELGLEDGAPWRFVEILNGRFSRALPSDFIRRRGVKSLLALTVSGRLLPEAPFYPLSMELREGMPLILRSPNGDLPLGRVSLLRPGLQVGVVDMSGAFGDAKYPLFNEMDALYALRQPPSRYARGAVFLGGRALFQIRPGPADRKWLVGLRPIRRSFLKIESPPELLGAASRRRSGTLSLRFRPMRGREVSVPLAAWRREEDAVSRFDSVAFQRPLRRPR